MTAPLKYNRLRNKQPEHRFSFACQLITLKTCSTIIKHREFWSNFSRIEAACIQMNTIERSQCLYFWNEMFSDRTGKYKKLKIMKKGSTFEVRCSEPGKAVMSRARPRLDLQFANCAAALPTKPEFPDRLGRCEVDDVVCRRFISPPLPPFSVKPSDTTAAYTRTRLLYLKSDQDSITLNELAISIRHLDIEYLLFEH